MVEWLALLVALGALGLTARRELIERGRVQAADLAVTWTRHPKRQDARSRDVFLLRNLGASPAYEISVTFLAGEKPAFINRWTRKNPLTELRPGHSVPLPTGPTALGASPPDTLHVVWTDGRGRQEAKLPMAPSLPTWPQG